MDFSILFFVALVVLAFVLLFSVVKIVPLDTTYGHGFGVIAENTWAAFQAAEAIEVEWGAAQYPADGAAISQALDDALASGEALPVAFGPRER